jgi:hypothetical protein
MNYLYENYLHEVVQDFIRTPADLFHLAVMQEACFGGRARLQPPAWLGIDTLHRTSVFSTR